MESFVIPPVRPPAQCGYGCVGANLFTCISAKPADHPALVLRKLLFVQKISRAARGLQKCGLLWRSPASLGVVSGAR